MCVCVCVCVSVFWGEAFPLPQRPQVNWFSLDAEEILFSNLQTVNTFEVIYTHFPTQTGFGKGRRRERERERGGEKAREGEGEKARERLIENME